MRQTAVHFFNCSLNAGDQRGKRRRIELAVIQWILSGETETYLNRSEPIPKTMTPQWLRPKFISIISHPFQISVIALSFIKCEDGVNALETPIRASHLKPRHYNPHPYQQYQPSGPNGEYVSVQSFHTDQHTTINDGDLSGYSLLSLSPTPATAAAPSPTPGNGIYRLVRTYSVKLRGDQRAIPFLAVKVQCSFRPQSDQTITTSLDSLIRMWHWNRKVK